MKWTGTEQVPSVVKYLGCTIVPTAAQMYFCRSKHPVFLSSAHRLKHTFNKWGFLDWIACVSSGRLVWDYSPPILRLRSFILLLACSVSTQQFLRFWKIKTNWKNKVILIHQYEHKTHLNMFPAVFGEMKDPPAFFSYDYYCYFLWWKNLSFKDIK